MFCFVLVKFNKKNKGTVDTVLNKAEVSQIQFAFYLLRSLSEVGVHYKIMSTFI